MLADDHRLLREAFTQLLAIDCDVVAAVADGRALLTAVAVLRPDVVVLDVAMPELNGLDAARRLRQDMPDVKLIFLTMSEDAEIAAEALQVRTSGYLLKNSAVAELRLAIQEVFRGTTYVTPLAAWDPAGSPGPAPRHRARRTKRAAKRGAAAAGRGFLDEADRPRPQNHAPNRRLS